MKLKTLLLCGLSLLSCPPLFAQSGTPDPVAEQLFTPEFLRQHHEALGLTEEQKGWFKEAFEKVQARIAELQPRLTVTSGPANARALWTCVTAPLAMSWLEKKRKAARSAVGCEKTGRWPLK